MADTVTLAWDPNPNPNLAGYRLYYRIATQSYTQSIDVGNATTVSVPSLIAGQTYLFAVTAYNTHAVESVPSTEVSYTVPVAAAAAAPSPAQASAAATPTPTAAAGTTSMAMAAPATPPGWTVRRTRLLKRMDRVHARHGAFIEAAAYARWCREQDSDDLPGFVRP
jgi:hypothetical protein